LEKQRAIAFLSTKLYLKTRFPKFYQVVAYMKFISFLTPCLPPKTNELQAHNHLPYFGKRFFIYHRTKKYL